MTGKSFVSGAIVLMIAGFIVKILGFIYRIYLSNLIGAEGMGIFQLIAPVYSLVILTLSSGISIAVSKMVAEQTAKNNHVNLIRIASCALAIVVAGALIASLGIFIFIDPIVNVILKDSRTYYSMLLLLPCIPVIAAASAVKGYYYGVQDVVPTACSQVVEQVVRIGIVMLMAGYFVDIGLEYACALATVGMAVGEISNLAVLLLIFKIRKRKSLLNKSKKGFMRKRTICTNLMKISMPISFNRFITSMMGAIELILIPRMLLIGGMNYQASLVEYGKLTGMAMPLVFFPSLVTSSLATTLVPAISEALSLKSFKIVNYRISKSIQFTFILGFIFTSIFIGFSNEIGDLVYRNENIGHILYSLSFTCIFIYLQQTLLGILNGLGKQGVSLRNSIAGYIIRILFVVYCIPVYGIQGYIAGIVISSACVCILNVYTVTKMTGMALDFRNWILKPGIVCIAIVFADKYINSFFTIFGMGSSVTVIVNILGNVVIAFGLMFVIGAIDKEEVLKLLK
ncbi:stage V sporulation protein B [Herbivorax sp. ANBcel31]|uniref:stage V sporulation protein B n=1 Tax=Herbivorax sp. ANBcel31 TaxID=3069754 RepID=UPI0027B7C00A|nr:stage V sporulation protein B [Herbivorax sp. ANBcel31]MDQ2085607.1 stage V sporulation protein B [Herbivorax sp. ANBcel31]